MSEVDSPQLDVDVAFGDLDAAIVRFADGQADPDEGRRGLNEALLYLYVIEQAFASQSGQAYWHEASQTRAGQLTQALTYVRGIATHRLVDPAESFGLSPGEDVFPSDELFPGSIHLFWLEWDELEPWVTPQKGARDKRALVRTLLAGHRVLPSLRAAQRFLSDYRDAQTVRRPGLAAARAPTKRIST